MLLIQTYRFYAIRFLLLPLNPLASIVLQVLQVGRELSHGLPQASNHDFGLEVAFLSFNLFQRVLVWLHVDRWLFEKLLNLVSQGYIAQPV